MEIMKSELEGFFAILPKIYEDSRGFFMETYQSQRYNNIGINEDFIQDNHSRSKKGVIRGLHFQLQRPQAQIVTLLRGHIFDVVVDLRKNSSTFGKWASFELSDKTNFRQVYMAPGFAHGFLTLSEYSDLHYKVSEIYNPNDEYGLIWNDDSVGIQWPKLDFNINERDQNFPCFDVIKEFL